MSAADAAVAAVAKTVHAGQCLCGAVSYTGANLSDIWYCHCKQCQHLTGLYIAAAGVNREDITITGTVNWLPISDRSKSGHCADCGSYLFWNADDFDTISVLAGSLNNTDGLDVKGHIFVSQKGDYYDVTDGLPQFETYPPEGTRPTEELKP